MLTDKEKEQFMPKEEVKLRKWVRRELCYSELAFQTEDRLNKTSDVQDKIYFQKIHSILLVLAESANKHQDKWSKRLKEVKAQGDRK